MKFVILTRDQEIIDAARSPSAFPPTDQVCVCGDPDDALVSCVDADLIVVDLLATLNEPHKIAGYEEFAHKKMDHPSAKDTPLVLVGEPDNYELDFMAGFPNFVFARISRPVTDKILRRVSTWV